MNAMHATRRMTQPSAPGAGHPAGTPLSVVRTAENGAGAYRAWAHVVAATLACLTLAACQLATIVHPAASAIFLKINAAAVNAIPAIPDLGSLGGKEIVFGISCLVWWPVALLAFSPGGALPARLLARGTALLLLLACAAVCTPLVLLFAGR